MIASFCCCDGAIAAHEGLPLDQTAPSGSIDAALELRRALLEVAPSMANVANPTSQYLILLLTSPRLHPLHGPTP